MKILVLGLGNDLHGDDGVGLRVVSLLRHAWLAGARPAATTAEVDFEECCASGAALLEVLHGYDAVLIVDTIFKREPATGRVRILEAMDIRDVPGPSPHYISVPQTLALGRRLGLKMPVTMKVVAVEAADLLQLNEGLSEEMKAHLPAILEVAQAVLIRLVERVCPAEDQSRRVIDNSGRTG